MPLKFIFGVILIFIFSPSSYGFTLIFSGGLGGATSADEASVTETPLFQSYKVEYQFSGISSIGVEHARSFSLSPMASSTSFTGLYSKYYFYQGGPVSYMDSFSSTGSDNYVSRIWAPYLGLGLGIGQGSFLPREGLSANSAAFYLAVKGGVDLQVSENWLLGVSLEIYQSFAGSGTLKGDCFCGSLGFTF